jgi:hypothetical protein
LWRFNTLSKKWKKLTMTFNVPDQLASHTAAMYKGRMLVYGGTGAPFGQTTSTTVFVLDLGMRSWSKIKTGGNRRKEDGDDHEDEADVAGQLPRPLYGQGRGHTYSAKICKKKKYRFRG